MTLAVDRCMMGTTLFMAPVFRSMMGLSRSSVGTLSAHRKSVLHCCQAWEARQRTSSENLHREGAWYRSGSLPGMFV
jgi:hypothetical protein